ncbi:hypothetical protein EGW08_017520 [Elysia chlorotica]|uniref:MRH domain-containing protein n=1 Tax=Elysia chlorotica TaxID=188477 RepID=A0A433SZJ2_ELYCH|nr:hypothetical protein EGW08_017520 [Elysia chlorotica]
MEGRQHQPVFGNSSRASKVSLIAVFLLTFLMFSDAAEDLCQFTKYKESETLQASKQMLSPLVGKSYKSRNSEYEFTVGICTQVAEQVGKNVAVLQQKLSDDGKPDPSEAHDIGNLVDTHIMTGSDWILLEYRGLEKYGERCNQEAKRTTIMITCDELVKDSDARMVYIEEENQKEEDCYYLFELKHEAVCPNPTSGGLSVGSILLIVFFSVASVYLFVGFLYSRFVLGAKGMEQIPNYEFWKDFGNLQAEGCDLVCRTREPRRAGGFRGIGDDQLDRSDDMPVVRDENLLPM